METTEFLDHLLSAEAVANNVDLLNKIFLQLPAKTLVRFKCVSTHWLSLISDHKFCTDHMRKNLNSVLGLYINSHPLVSLDTKSPNGLPKLDFLAKLFQVKPKILHSCNGLMLCSCGHEIIVCNLTTQKFKVVPSLSCHLVQSRADKFLAFNPMRSPHYKVVFIQIGVLDLMECSIYSYDINIYSSETGIWKPVILRGPQCDPLTHSVLCDGAIYWIVDGNNLVRFDIHEENLKIIHMPVEPVLERHFFSYFEEYGGHLFFITPNRKGKFQILEMDMDNYRWMVNYDVDLGPIIHALNGNANRSIDTFYNNVGLSLNWLGYDGQSIVVLDFKGGIEEEIPALLFAVNEKIISYNPVSNSWEFIQQLPVELHGIMDFMGFRPHKFIDSLASV